MRDRSNRTSLWWAAAMNSLQMFNLLLDYLPESNLKDIENPATCFMFEGATPLHWATRRNNQPMIDILVSKVSAHILKGIVNKRACTGKTPLGYVQRHGNTQTEEIFLQMIKGETPDYGPRPGVWNRNVSLIQQDRACMSHL